MVERARSVLDATSGIGPVEVRTTKSQVAFRLQRGFAYVWRPGQYLERPGAEAVLSIALGRRVDLPRFKEVAHPASTVWTHHLELHEPGDVAWLRQAADAAR